MQKKKKYNNKKKKRTFSLRLNPANKKLIIRLNNAFYRFASSSFFFFAFPLLASSFTQQSNESKPKGRKRGS